jgi:hypothetical protein
MNHGDLARNAKAFSVWTVETDDGIEREFIELKDFPVIERIIRKQGESDIRYKNDDVVLKMILKALGVEPNESVTSMQLLGATLLQGKWLLDNEDYVTIGSTNGYISGSLDIKNVLKKSYVDSFQNLFDGFHKFIESEIVLDEEKKEKYLDTLQGG